MLVKQNVSIQQCYKSENGNELIPNGYLNVQLKSADDYPKLQTIAAENGCDIIEQNQFMHLGYNLKIKELLEHAIDSAVTRGREGKGCVFVKSAGNTYGTISYPGDYSQDVLAVANMTIDGTLARSSGHGPNLFVTAPGSDILSTIRNNQIARMGGTSMACPHVAGLAA